MTIEHIMATSDVDLNDEVLHLADTAGGDHFESFAQILLAESRGYDLMLYTCAYAIRGQGDHQGNFMVNEGAVNQTTFIMVPQKNRGVMHDSDFIQTGWNPQQYHEAEDLKVIREGDKTTWQLKNWEQVARPPHWDLKGSHVGLGFDLTFAGSTSAWWYMGPWTDLSKTQRAGYDQLEIASGSIAVHGENYPVSEAHAIHEHLALGTSYDMLETLSDGAFYWIFGANDDIQLLTFSQPGSAYGRLQVEGRTIPYESADVTLDVVSRWTDPKSHLNVPCEWHMNLFSSEGILDVNVKASGRAYYFYCLKSGYIAIYMFLANANGHFMFPDGRRIEVKDMRMMIEYGRTILEI